MEITLSDIEVIADIAFKLSATIVMAMLIWTAIDHRKQIEKLEDLHDRKD